jgi:magnesium chelatase family protein
LLARVLSSAVIGIDAYLVEVEVDIAQGIPDLHHGRTAGSRGKGESKSGSSPRSPTPAIRFRPTGSRSTWPLPTYQKRPEPASICPWPSESSPPPASFPERRFPATCSWENCLLDGRVKPVNGSLPMAIRGPKSRIPRHCCSRRTTGKRHPWSPTYPCIRFARLGQVVDFLKRLQVHSAAEDRPARPSLLNKIRSATDFAEVMGQEHAKRALEIAAAGGHNVADGRAHRVRARPCWPDGFPPSCRP